MKNQTAFLVEPRKIVIRDTSMPKVGDEDILVEIKHVGICGSDMFFFRDPTYGGLCDTKLPIVLGHECAGSVVAKGKNVTTYSVGDMVALEPGVPCGKCSYCFSGRYNLCPDMIFMSAPPFVSGALSKYVAHPACMSFKLPGDVDTIEGSLIEPLAVGMHAARRSKAGPGKTATILGAGCIGLMTMLSCKASGVTDIIMVDVFDNRLKKAMEMGASAVVNAANEDAVQAVMEKTDQMGSDLIFETAGSKETASMTPSVVARGGSIIIVGCVHDKVDLDLLSLGSKEADILSIFRYCNMYPPAIKLVAKGIVDVKSMVSIKFDFEQVQQAFEYALDNKQKITKAVIEL